MIISPLAYNAEFKEKVITHGGISEQFGYMDFDGMSVPIINVKNKNLKQ